MKLLVIFLMALYSGCAYCQSDSVKFKIEYPDEQTHFINDLNGVKFFKLVCTDTTFKEFKFILTYREFLEGKLISADTSMLDTSKKLIKVEIGGKIYEEKIDWQQNSRWVSSVDSLVLMVGGKQMGSEFYFDLSLSQTYSLEDTLSGGEMWDFRELDCSARHVISVPIKKTTPILAYAPPYDAGNGIASYCFRTLAAPVDWWRDFHIKRYYVFSLLVE